MRYLGRPVNFSPDPHIYIYMRAHTHTHTHWSVSCIKCDVIFDRYYARHTIYYVKFTFILFSIQQMQRNKISFYFTTYVQKVMRIKFFMKTEMNNK